MQFIDCKHINRLSIQQKPHASYNATQWPHKSWVMLLFILEAARGLTLSPEMRWYENKYTTPIPKADIYKLQAHSFWIWSRNRTTIALPEIQSWADFKKANRKGEMEDYLISLKNQQRNTFFSQTTTVRNSVCKQCKEQKGASNIFKEKLPG